MTHYDLIIIGTGSANSIPGPEFDDWNIAIVERGAFGGTCLNVGCIPSKMFVYAADVATHIAHAETYGITATMDAVDWPGIVERVFGRIDPIAEGGEKYRSEECENITVYGGSAVFTGVKQIEVNGETLTADHIVVGAGGRPRVPDIDGLDDITFHTSDTVMRLPELPRRMAVVGGGYIASELGHVFGSLGTDITMLVRGDTMLRIEDEEIRARATEMYSDRFDVRLKTHITAVRRDGDELVLTLDGDGGGELRVDELLIAAGRVPNTDQLDVAAAGLETHPDGRLVVDTSFATNVPGVWAFGDIATEHQLKHVANAEVRVLRQNLLAPDDLTHIDYGAVPHAVFGWPQVASVGLTEQGAREQGIDVLIARKDFGGTAYGWAMEDTQSFAKLLVDPATRLILGAHFLGPQSSVLIQQLIQAMQFNQTVDDVAHGQFYIHPALSEVTENLLLEVPAP